MTQKPFSWTPEWRKAMDQAIAIWKQRAISNEKIRVTWNSCALCVHSRHVSGYVDCSVCPVGQLGYHGCCGTHALIYDSVPPFRTERFQEEARLEVEFLERVRDDKEPEIYTSTKE